MVKSGFVPPAFPTELAERGWRTETVSQADRAVTTTYVPLTPDDDGRILCETVELWSSLRDGRLVMEDVQTEERLRTSGELEAENEDLKSHLQALQAQLEGQGTPEAE